jgi:uncharacterized protein
MSGAPDSHPEWAPTTAATPTRLNVPKRSFEIWETNRLAIVLDSGILYAFYDRRDEWHERTVSLFGDEEGSLIVPAPTVPEVDYLLKKRLPLPARTDFYRGLAGGLYFIVDLPPEGYRRVEELNLRFADLSLGFVDAAVVAISETVGVPRIATTDRRHFAPLAAAFGLELLP